VVGSALPQQLRAFLLTLAIVDDLLVIVIIAAFYTDDLAVTPLLATAGALGAYAFLQHRRVRTSMLFVPIAVAAWWFMHESGVHATIAGVALGLLTRVLPDEGERRSPAERLEHRLLPFSAGVAVPFFALMSAGVAVDLSTEFVSSPIVIGIVLGLVIGKPLGVMGGAWLVTRFTRAELNPEISWRELFGVAVLAGIGFTVALLVAELSFTGAQAEAAKTAVLLGSLIAAILAAGVLRRRNRAHKVVQARRRPQPHV
jgi:NhaA family Na+:H+ antiporter